MSQQLQKSLAERYINVHSMLSICLSVLLSNMMTGFFNNGTIDLLVYQPIIIMLFVLWLIASIFNNASAIGDWILDRYAEFGRHKGDGPAN